MVQNGKREVQRKISYDNQNPQFTPFFHLKQRQFFPCNFSAWSTKQWSKSSWDSWLTADKPEGEHPCEKHQTPVSNHPSLPGEGAPCQPLQWRWITLHQGCLSQLGYQKQDGCILTSSSSAGLTQRGFSLCIYMCTQIQTTLKWWGVHARAVLEAAQQQLCVCSTWTPLPCPPVSISQTEGWSLFPVSWWGTKRWRHFWRGASAELCSVWGQWRSLGAWGESKSELGHDVQ